MTTTATRWIVAIAASLGVHAAAASLFSPEAAIMEEGAAGGAVTSMSDIASVMAITGQDVAVDTPVEPQVLEDVATTQDIVPLPAETIAPAVVVQDLPMANPRTDRPVPPDAAIPADMHDIDVARPPDARPPDSVAVEPQDAEAAIGAGLPSVGVDPVLPQAVPDMSAAATLSPSDQVMAAIAPVISSVQPTVIEDMMDLPPLPAPRPWREIDEERRVEAERRAAEEARERERRAAREAEERRQAQARAEARQRQAEREARAERQRAAARGNARQDSTANRGAANSDRSRAGNEGQAAATGRFNASSYSGRVMSHLRRHQRYPRSARTAGLEGQATVRFTINQSGSVTAVRLVRSSGHAVLDEATLSMVRRASRFPAIPREANRSQMTFTAPIAYRLR